MEEIFLQKVMHGRVYVHIYVHSYKIDIENTDHKWIKDRDRKLDREVKEETQKMNYQMKRHKKRICNN